MKSKIGTILLAAGNSERMGQCKFLLTMDNGLTFFENIVQTFHSYGIINLVVVVQPIHISKLENLCCKMVSKPIFIANYFPKNDRFYSLQLGIKALKNVDFSFIHNSDSPFIDLETLHLLDFNKYQADYICPIANNKGGHPIIVNYSTLKYLAERPQNAILADELKKFNRLSIPVNNDLITIDIDTPEDYKKYFN